MHLREPSAPSGPLPPTGFTSGRYTVEPAQNDPIWIACAGPNKIGEAEQNGGSVRLAQAEG